MRNRIKIRTNRVTYKSPLETKADIEKAIKFLQAELAEQYITEQQRKKKPGKIAEDINSGFEASRAKGGAV